MLLAALGYVLIERLRALALQGTALASAQVDSRPCNTSAPRMNTRFAA
jgi:hypothetical protein